MMEITKRDKKGRILKGNNLRHGKSNEPVYDTWIAMKARCQNEAHPCYKHYGGRGIKVCQRWQSFDCFFEDMGEIPRGCTLDRIDNDGDYEPSNCRWTTIQRQQANRRNNNEVVGVVFEEDRKRWRVDITAFGKSHFLGRYIDKETAVAKRALAEKLRDVWGRDWKEQYALCKDNCGR